MCRYPFVSGMQAQPVGERRVRHVFTLVGKVDSERQVDQSKQVEVDRTVQVIRISLPSRLPVGAIKKSLAPPSWGGVWI